MTFTRGQYQLGLEKDVWVIGKTHGERKGLGVRQLWFKPQFHGRKTGRIRTSLGRACFHSPDLFINMPLVMVSQ